MVAFRLVLLSILVGVVAGCDRPSIPGNILESIRLLFQAAVEPRLRCGELAVALLPAGCGDRDPDLAVCRGCFGRPAAGR